MIWRGLFRIHGSGKMLMEKPAGILALWGDDARNVKPVLRLAVARN
jgi:hypothetical protein